MHDSWNYLVSTSPPQVAFISYCICVRVALHVGEASHLLTYSTHSLSDFYQHYFDAVNNRVNTRLKFFTPHAYIGQQPINLMAVDTETGEVTVMTWLC